MKRCHQTGTVPTRPTERHAPSAETSGRPSAPLTPLVIQSIPAAPELPIRLAERPGQVGGTGSLGPAGLCPEGIDHGTLGYRAAAAFVGDFDKSVLEANQIGNFRPDA